MEEKLREFRNRRRREQIWETVTLKRIMDRWYSSPPPVITVHPPSAPVTPTDTSSSLTPLCDLPSTPDSGSGVTPLNRTLSNASIASSNTSGEWSSESQPPMSRLTFATYILYALLWITCWLIAIQLRFGAVFLVISGLLAIYFNTRTDPKKPGELSAYSVFNPNCEAIDGTLKPEQFEKEFNLIHHSPS